MSKKNSNIVSAEITTNDFYGLSARAGKGNSLGRIGLIIFVYDILIK